MNEVDELKALIQKQTELLSRCLELLKEVKNCAPSYEGTKYSEVQIPHELMEAIKAECND